MSDILTDDEKHAMQTAITSLHGLMKLPRQDNDQPDGEQDFTDCMDAVSRVYGIMVRRVRRRLPLITEESARNEIAASIGTHVTASLGNTCFNEF